MAQKHFSITCATYKSPTKMAISSFPFHVESCHLQNSPQQISLKDNNSKGKIFERGKIYRIN
jgi:hypothetical protein